MARIRTATVAIFLNATTTVPSDVFAYEIPVLEAIHGDLDEQLVRVVSEGAIEVDISNPADLYAALQAKYGKKGGDVVKSVYPDRRAFDRALDASIEDDETPKRKAAKKSVKKDDPPPPGDESDEGDEDQPQD